MPEKTIEAWYGIPPERDDPVVDLFIAPEGPQWGTVECVSGRAMLNIFPLAPGELLSLPVDELIEVLRIAKDRFG